MSKVNWQSQHTANVFRALEFVEFLEVKRTMRRVNIGVKFIRWHGRQLKKKKKTS